MTGLEREGCLLEAKEPTSGVNLHSSYDLAADLKTPERFE